MRHIFTTRALESGMKPIVIKIARSLKHSNYNGYLQACNSRFRRTRIRKNGGSLSIKFFILCYNYHMNNSLFSISIDSLKLLEEKDAVKVFKALLQAEAYRYNVPVTKIQITENTKAADGGIDATIDCRIPEGSEDIIKNGQVNYQIKADNSFNSLSESAILKELLGSGTIEELNSLSPRETKNRLKQKIKETVEQDKYYVLVSFRTEAEGTKKQDAINIIKNILIKCGYSNPKVDIFDSTNLQLAINRYPAIVNKITPLPDNISNVLDVLNEERLNEKFYYNQELHNIENIFDNFYNDKTDYKHLRILAEPGVGKTKAVLEFCKKYNFNTLYIETAEKFEDSNLYSFLKRNKDISITLIIDECNISNAETFYGRLKNTVPQLKLITIYNDFKQNTSDSETKVIILHKLSNEDFSDILVYEYNMERPLASHLASFCEGYPRLAHYIGKNFIANREVLDNLDDILESLIIGSETNQNNIKNIICVMQYFSIFKKFGFSESFEEEKDIVLNLIKCELPNLTSINLENIVNDLKRRKILQQEHTLYISPKILHIWLYGNFWKNSSRKKQIFDSIKDFPQSLRKWFGEMFEYAQNAQISTDIPKELLEQFGYNDFLNKNTSDFFLSLTKACPKVALRQLTKIFNNLSNQEILNIIDGRMNLVWALQYILFDKNLFLDAIDILYKLAVNENEKVFSNNATGIFQQIFQISLSGTEVDLETRKNILSNYTKTATVKEEFNLLIKTFNSSLNTHYFSRIGGMETQGFEIKQDYYPKTYGEIFDYFESIINLLIFCIENCKDEELKQKALNAITSNSGALIRYSEYTCNLIYKIFDKLTNNESIKKSNLYMEISKIIQQLKLIKDENIILAINHFEALRNSLIEDKPKITLETYFNANIWDIAGEKENAFEYFIEQLSETYQSIDTIQQKKLIKTFVDEKYDNEYYFGVMVARQDSSFNLLKEIIDYYKISNNKNGLFVVGYLSELYKKSNEEYDNYAQKIYDLKLYDLIINLNSKAFTTVLTANLASEAIINEYVLASSINSFAWNTSCPLNVIKKLLCFAKTKKTLDTIKSALNILYHNKEFWNNDNFDLIFEILNSVVVVQTSSVIALTDNSYIWTSVLLKYIKEKSESEEVFTLLDKFLAFISDYENHNAIYSAHIASILDACSDLNPKKTWQKISCYLSLNILLFSPIKTWLRGDDNFDHNIPGAMSNFAIEDIFAWIDEDVENRLKIIAYCSPKDLFKENGYIMRSLLVKYAYNPKLYHYLHINFGNKGWIGNASSHTKSEIEIVKKFQAKEKNSSVSKFINEYLENLENELKRHIIEEERFDF